MDLVTFYLTILGLGLLVPTGDTARCDRVKIDNDYYTKHLVANVDGYPSDMAIDPVSEHIYFLLNKRNRTRGFHILKYGSLGASPLPITDDYIGQCIAFDAMNNLVYVGTNQGIVTYDANKNDVNLDRPIGDDDVKRIFINRDDNQMYIITGDQREIYRFINGSASIVRYEKLPKAYTFVFDKKGNIFYEYLDGRLYFYSIDLYEPIQYKGLTKELRYVMAMSTSDEAIVAVRSDLFKLRTNSDLPIKIGNLGFKISGMAFDARYNLFIGTKDKIYKYKYVSATEPCASDDYFMSPL